MLGEKAAEAVTELLDGKIGPADCHSPIWKLRFLFLNPVMIRLSDRLMGFLDTLGPNPSERLNGVQAAFELARRSTPR